MNNPAAAALAVGAAMMFGTADAVEHSVVSNLEPHEGHSIMARLWRSRRWLGAYVVSVAAFGLYAAALSFGTLLIVQPLIVLGLLLALMLSARWRRHPLRKSEWIAAILLCGSLAVFLIEAAPSGGTDSASVLQWLRVGAPFFCVGCAAALVARYSVGARRAALLAFAAGAFYALTSALTKTFTEHIQHGIPYTASHWEVYGLAAISIAGIVFTQHAFEAKSLTASLPVLQISEPLGASIIGAALLRERLNGKGDLSNALIGLSIVVMIAAVIHLSRAAGEVRTEPYGTPQVAIDLSDRTVTAPIETPASALPIAPLPAVALDVQTSNHNDSLHSPIWNASRRRAARKNAPERAIWRGL
jgi:drug/metabolite transporter (DMT)-like permease